MSGYWFKPKRYGYGATPATWQGWAVTAAGAAVVVAATTVMASVENPYSASVWIPCALAAGSVVVWMVIVSYRKSEGEWRWRWGSE
jgi:hypothetical protein